MSSSLTCSAARAVIFSKASLTPTSSLALVSNKEWSPLFSHHNSALLLLTFLSLSLSHLFPRMMKGKVSGSLTPPCSINSCFQFSTLSKLLQNQLNSVSQKKIKGNGIFYLAYLLSSDIVNDDTAVGTPVKGGPDGLEPLLPGCVPNLEGVVLPLVGDVSRKEVGSDCCPVLRCEFSCHVTVHQ